VIVQRGGEPAWAPHGVIGLASDDRAVQWLLDRNAVRDALVRHTVVLERDDHRREFLGTRLITLEGDDAWAESYAIVTALAGGEARSRPADIVTPIHYTDHFARTADGWQLADRSVDTAGRFRPLPAAPPASDDPRVRRLVDRAMISDVVVASAYALDRRDEGLLRECEAPAIVLYAADGSEINGIDAQLANLRREMWATDESWLFLDNQLVDFDTDGNAATVQTYVFWVERRAPGEEPTSWTDGAVRFLDHVERDGDRWRLVERRVANNVMSDDKVMVRPQGEEGIEAMTRRAEARAREWQQAGKSDRER
jgi:hypothetical protein